jgi:hypothetical protein
MILRSVRYAHEAFHLKGGGSRQAEFHAQDGSYCFRRRHCFLRSLPVCSDAGVTRGDAEHAQVSGARL